MFDWAVASSLKVILAQGYLIPIHPCQTQRWFSRFRDLVDKLKACRFDAIVVDINSCRRQNDSYLHSFPTTANGGTLKCSIFGPWSLFFNENVTGWYKSDSSGADSKYGGGNRKSPMTSFALSGFHTQPLTTTTVYFTILPRFYCCGAGVRRPCVRRPSVKRVISETIKWITTRFCGNVAIYRSFRPFFSIFQKFWSFSSVQFAFISAIKAICLQ